MLINHLLCDRHYASSRSKWGANSRQDSFFHGCYSLEEDTHLKINYKQIKQTNKKFKQINYKLK